MIKALSVYTSQEKMPVQEDFVLGNREKEIMVLADGFGGPRCGSEAARIACESVKGFLEKEAGDEEATLPYVLRSYMTLAGNVLFNALVHANRKVLALNRNKSVHEKGGASVIAAYLDGDLLAIANVGACTAWLFREGRGVELVAPRTYARMRDPFLQDAPRAWRAPLAALGMVEDIEPEIVEYRVRPGDALLLQSDGLDSEGRDRILEIHRRSLDPDTVCREAIQALKSYESDDNLSISLAIF